MHTDHENHSHRDCVYYCWVKDRSEWIPYKWWIEEVWHTWARPLCQPAGSVLSIRHLMWSLSWFLEVGAGKPDLSEVDQLSQVTIFHGWTGFRIHILDHCPFYQDSDYFVRQAKNQAKNKKHWQIRIIWLYFRPYVYVWKVEHEKVVFEMFFIGTYDQSRK